MAAFADLCRFIPLAGGLGDFAYASAVAGCQSPARAGVQNGVLYKCFAIAGDLSQWEIFEGAYNLATLTFPRTTVLYNSSGTGTASGQTGAGSKINFLSVPQVAVVALAEDLISVTQLGTGVLNALGIPIGSAGAPVLFNGAGGTPTSLLGTNITGTAAGLTAGNVSTNANLTGDVTSVGNATTLTNAAAIAKVLTGFASAPGTVTAADSLLSAIQKLNGNIAAGRAGALLQSTPSNPTGTTSTTGVMMGLGAACTITPTYSTRVEFAFRFGVGNTGTTGSVSATARFGTGAAPANAAALAGTTVGPASTIGIPAINTLYGSSGVGGIITGLTVGVAYWFDISLSVISGTGVLQNVSCTAKEI